LDLIGARADAGAGLIEQLLGSEDPTLAYRARVLAGSPVEEAPETLELRAGIAHSPRAAALLSHRDRDGTIRLHPYAKWQGPHWTLVSLALLDYPPGDLSLVPLREQVYGWLLSRQHLRPSSTVTYADQPDRVRRCASQEGNAIWYSLRLGLEDECTETLVDRLIAWQWPDGGWNCDKRPQARTASFQETAIPLRALWAFGRRYGHRGALDAAGRAAECLLSRRLLWRRRDGALIRPDWGGGVDRIHFPIQFYDVLFALQALADVGSIGDPRCADAIQLLESKQLADGGFPREEPTCVTRARIVSRGSWADWGSAGRRRSNPFVSLAALSVLVARRQASLAV
jgi:hypothetical protein